MGMTSVEGSRNQHWSTWIEEFEDSTPSPCYAWAYVILADTLL